MSAIAIKLLRRSGAKPIFRIPQIHIWGSQIDQRKLGTLAYEEVEVSEESSPPIASTAFVLHGLLGSGRNWRSFSRHLASSLLTDAGAWRIVLVDLRNHGRSESIEGLDPPHDMANSARDLANLVKHHGWSWPDVVIGHSLGGKVALDFVTSCARGDYGGSAILPKQLWVLDSVPGEVKSEDSDGEVEKVLQTLQNIPNPVPSRRWLIEQMLSMGFSKTLSEWIGSNLKKAGEGEQMTWAFNLKGCIEMFESYRQTSYWDLLEEPPRGLEVVVMQAEKSDRWTPDVLQKLEAVADKGDTVDLKRGRVVHKVLPDAGHWVHVDNPTGLIDIMAPRIRPLVQSENVASAAE